MLVVSEMLFIMHARATTKRHCLQVDHAIQYGEDLDVKIRDFGMGEAGNHDMDEQ